MRSLPFWAALVLFTLPALSFAQESAFTLSETNLDVPAATVSSLDDYRLVRVDVAALHRKWQRTPGLLNLTLRGAGTELDLHLAPFDLRKPGHTLNVMTGAGATPVAPSRTATYRGNLTGGGEAIFTFDEQFVLGTWEKDGRRMALQPLWRLWEEAPQDVYLLYDEADEHLPPGACGTDDDTHDVRGGDGGNGPGSGGGKSLVGDCFEVDIALVADTEMFNDFNQNATSVVNFMENVLANVRTVYDDEFADEVAYVVASTTVYTNANPDPYTNSTNSGTLLNSFTNVTNDDPGPLGTYDVATLWSGRNFDGETIGVAWLNAICTNFRYNILENFSTNATQLRNLWAHELGHNWNASHDAQGSNTIMAPSITFSSVWSQASITSIQAHYNSRSCLADCSAPVPPAAEAEVAFPTICAEGTTVFYDVTDEEDITRQWSFPGGTPATSTAVAPEVFYPNPGTYTPTLTTTNPAGTDSDQVQVTVTADQPSGDLLLFYEDFEDDDLNVIFSNPNNDQLQWITAETDGNLGNRAAVADNGTLDFPNTTDFIITPSIDLSGLATATLSLEYAYVRFDAQFRDQLRITVSANGSRSVVFFGDENGSGNFATGPDKSTTGGGLFTPAEAADWCFSGPGCVEIDLSPFAGSSDVVIEIENVSGFGQPMWVDNIAVTSSCDAQLSLPVEWLDFTAAPEGKVARLDWAVNQDEAHAGFRVERAAADGSDWQSVGYLPATGGAANDVAYAFTDATVLGGNTYLYRLRQQDVDGNESFSVIRTVSFADRVEDGVSVFPNPTTGQLQLRYAAAAGSEFRLYGALGNRVRGGILPAGGTTLQIGDLPPGIYLLRVGETEAIKVVKR